MRELEIAMALWGICAVSATVSVVTSGGFRGVPDAVASALAVCLMATGVSLFLAENIWLVDGVGHLGIGLAVAALVVLVVLMASRAIRRTPEDSIEAVGNETYDVRPPSGPGNPYRTLQGRPWSARPPSRSPSETRTSGWSYTADDPSGGRR